MYAEERLKAEIVQEALQKSGEAILPTRDSATHRRERRQHPTGCLAFGISQTCYRRQAKQPAENVEIADLLTRLTHNQRNWGFGLCSGCAFCLSVT